MNDGRELWERLRAAGVVQGEMPSEERPAPWYVRAVQGLSGWLAAVCLLIFLGTLFHDLFRQSGALLALGGLLTALAAALLHRPSGSDFRAQFGLVFSLAGQVMLLGGFKDYWDTSGFWLLWAGFQVVLVLRILLPVHRFISAMAVIYALTFASAHTPLLWLVSGCLSAALAWVMLTENHRMPNSAIWSPVTAAIAIALLQTYGLALLGPALLAEMLRHQDVQPPTVFLRNLNETLVALVWMGTAGWLLHQRAAMMSARMRGLAWAGIVAVALWSTQAQGLTVAWLMLVLGFARSNPVLAGLGTTVFWGFLFRYYYLMQTPLLTKSAILGGGGLVFLLAYAVLHRLGREEERHA